MARRYDSRTTIFSPEGRLYQVEYAMEAIGHAGTALGIVGTDGIVLAAERKITSKLLDDKHTSYEKIYTLNENIAAAVAGITADANILINTARLHAQRYQLQYCEMIPVELLAERLCDVKQGYTQYGGLRPFGVSFLYGGWDDHYGFQLYHSDPSGNYFGWKAHCIGANHQTATGILKQDYREDMSLHDATGLALKILSKTIETSNLTSDKLEVATITRVDDGYGGKKVQLKLLKAADIEGLLKAHANMIAPEGPQSTLPS